MPSFKKIAHRIINTPTILISLAVIKLPFFNNYKIHLLSTWADVEKRSKIDNLLFGVFLTAWVRFEYLKETDPDKRESLNLLLMGGEPGQSWAKSYQSIPFDLNQKVGHMTLKDACPLFEELRTILSNLNQKCIVIQVGSSSGREIRYFADMFPQHEFIGTDISDEAVSYSSSFHALPNLSFEKLSAKDIDKFLNGLNAYSTDQKLFIFSSGALTYVQPAHLMVFFKALSKNPNVSIIINEPGSELNGMPDKLQTSIYRGNFSYTHDYKYYAEESGMETVKCEIIKPYYPYKDFPEYRDNVVHYFYYSRARKFNRYQPIKDD